MVALRYAYVLALSVWFGGIFMVAAILTQISDRDLHRFFVTSYVSGALVIVTLFAMALLGPRPSGFFARMAVAVTMLALTIYASFQVRSNAANLLMLAGAAGLALLFWEARDGTRAA